MHLTTPLTGLLAALSIPVTNAKPDVIHKDVLIVGGGASGSYAAVRLREDYGKSILLIEKEAILGGHVDSFVDPETQIPYDYGVKTFLDAGNATGFFHRLGVERGPSENPVVTTEYIDFTTGEKVAFAPPPFEEQIEALSRFLEVVEPWEHLLQPGYFDFPEPTDIPEDLLIPFGEFVTKHGVEKALPLVYESTGLGLGNMTNELTMFVVQSFGPSMARAILGLQETYIPASGRIQDLYDAVAALLGRDVLYSSTVVDTKRTDKGIYATVKNHKTGKLTKVIAERLLIAIEPTATNTAPFDLDKNERQVLGKFTYTQEYTGILSNAAFAENYSYFNLPPSAAPSNYLSYPEVPFTARIDDLGPGHFFRVTIIGGNDLDARGAKRVLQNDVNTLFDAGVLNKSESGKAEWVAFATHGPMHARVTVGDVKKGFFQELNALQGQRSTWWTGGAWSTNFQTTLWEYDDILIPQLLEGLD